MSKEKVAFMAFGSGSNTNVDPVGFKKYVGTGVCRILAINPTKKELEDIYKTSIDKEPEYTSKDQDGKSQVRIDFILQTVPEKNNGIDTITKLSFFLKKIIRYNTDKTKVQVINKYGETAWPLEEDAKKGVIPANTPWYIGPYRPAYEGEEQLTGFIKTFLGIPARAFRDANGVEHVHENPSLCEAQLEDIANYFSGNFKELKTIIGMQKDNTIKVKFGVKNIDGKEYQDLFNRSFARGNSKNTAKLESDVDTTKANGGYPNTLFSAGPLVEYTVTETSFTNTPSEQPKADIKDFFSDMD